MEVADQTFYLTQLQFTDNGPTSLSADPIIPYHTIQHNTTQYNATQQRNTTQPNTIQYNCNDNCIMGDGESKASNSQ